MNYDLEQRIRSDLQPGEKMLWTGQPAQGLRLRPSDAFAIPFSLLWVGFLVFGFSGTWQNQAGNAPPPFFLIPFVAVGVYILLGRFLVDAVVRSHTYYGVTSQRVIILSGVWTREVQSLQLRTMREITLQEGWGSRGTIEFGSRTWPMSRWSRGFNWPGMSRYQLPSFDLIDEPRQVYNLIRKTQGEVSEAP